MQFIYDTVWGYVVTAIITAIATFLYTRRPLVMTRGLFAALLFAALSMIYVQFIVLNIYGDPITTANVQKHLREWHDDYGYQSVQKEAPSAFFLYTVTDVRSEGNSVPIEVSRRRDRRSFITFRAPINLPPVFDAKFRALPKSEIEHFEQMVRFEVGRQHMQSEFDKDKQVFTLQTQLPITLGMRETDYVSKLHDITNASNLASAMLASNLIGMAERKEQRPAPKR